MEFDILFLGITAIKINFNNRFLGKEIFIEEMFGVKNIEKGPGRPFAFKGIVQY